MTDDKTDINDIPLRSPLDPSLSDTAMGSGIAQLEPSESMPDDEDILDLGDDGEIEDMEESVLDLGDADEDTLSGDSEILELSTELEELMDTHTDQEENDDNDSDQEVIDVGDENEASENAETAVSEPKTKSRAPDENNEIFSTGNESSDAADNLAMLTGGSTEPKTEDLSVFGDQSDRKVDNNDIAKLSEKPKPLTKEMKLRRKNLKLQQSKQSTHTLRKTGIPLLITMGILLLIVGVWTIHIGQNYDPTRGGGNALKDNWGLFAFASILLGVLLIGAAAFLQYEMIKFNKAADKFSRKLQEETGEEPENGKKNGKKSAKSAKGRK